MRKMDIADVAISCDIKCTSCDCNNNNVMTPNDDNGGNYGDTNMAQKWILVYAYW